MKKIYNIISSELLVRTNNVSFKQEYGEIGTSSNVYTNGNSTEFVTNLGISTILYITVNGVNLVEDVHYEQSGPNTIKISRGGAPLKNNPSITTTVLVAYFDNGVCYAAPAGIPPVIASFTVNPISGGAGVLTFDYSILANEGTGIFWSLYKEGEVLPIHSGTSLISVDGTYLNEAGNWVSLNYQLSEAYYAANQGRDLTFTMITTYNMDGQSTGDKSILASAGYHMDDVSNYASIASFPSLISQATDDVLVEVNFQLIDNELTPSTFTWGLYKVIGSGDPVLIDTGDQTTIPVTRTFNDLVSGNLGDMYVITYYIAIKTPEDVLPYTVARTSVDVIIANTSGLGRAGYLDASIMSYEPVAGADMIKIGSLGSAQDVIEYNNRVPSAIFTKEVDESIIDEETFINATVNEDTVTTGYVYFVLEAPSTWPSLQFQQSTGMIDTSAFNIIPGVGEGGNYTAYLYADAPSDVTGIPDYNISTLDEGAVYSAPIIPTSTF